MTNDNQMIYLNINNTSKGLKVFGCGTRYDYYLIEKNKKYKNTIIIDEENISISINLEELPFIPNKNISFISSIITNNKNKNIEVLKPGGDPRREYISDIKTDKYKYIMIHSTPNNGVRYKYCSIMKENDHFGKKKIIFGETSINNNIVIDECGIYGCTSCSFAIKVNNNFNNIKQVLISDKFKLILDSCQWSNYRIDWRLFTYIKKIY